MKRKYKQEFKYQLKSHIVWNYHNPNNKIGRGRYRDVIHHKDRNYANNNISNLQKITTNTHTGLHRKGKTASIKSRRKMSITQKERIAQNDKAWRKKIDKYVNRIAV